MAMENQRTRVLNYMREFGSITSKDAFVDLGIMDLPKRISELRQSGVEINGTPESAKNRYGANVTYMRYSLAVSKNG